MIYAITLNPALDEIILMEENLVVNKTNYYDDKYTVIGGKGINVGVVLHNLGLAPVLTGLMGNDNKAVFLNKFKELNIKSNFFFNQGSTRTNYKIKNLALKQETEVNGTGFSAEKNMLDALLNYLEDHVKADDIVVVTGSVPKGVNEDIYARIGAIVENNAANFVCDAANNVLKNALTKHPYVIKPNTDELKALLGDTTDDESFEKIEDLVRQAKTLGARNILLSMGSKGSYYFSEDGDVYQIGVAKGKLKNSVGAGDSMLAGYIYGLSENLPIKKTLQYAAAAGGATAFTEWLATKEEINHYVDEIEVTKIK